jgi:hypothetical protein
VEEEEREKEREREREVHGKERGERASMRDAIETRSD